MKRFQATREEVASLCRRAPEFVPVAERTEIPSFECCEDLFAGLVQSIIFQQLAVRAAEVISGRVEKLLGEISAENLLAADFDALRACGLSGRKIEATPEVKTDFHSKIKSVFTAQLQAKANNRALQQAASGR